MVAACASGEAFMAQVWLTFEEIQDLFGCDAADARRRVIANQWERRRGTDGVFRAQLPPDAAHQFMFRYGGENASPAVEASNFEAAMAALRRVFAEDEGEVSRACRGEEPRMAISLAASGAGHSLGERRRHGGLGSLAPASKARQAAEPLDGYTNTISAR